LIVVFAVAGAECALPLASVLEIARPLPATPLAEAPAWVLGTAGVGGDVVPLIDLAGFLGLGHGGQAEGRLLVVRNRGADRTTGLVVDRVTGVRSLPPDPLAAPAASDERLAPYLRGVAVAEGRPLPVLDPDLLLEAPAMRHLGEGV
jgi:chemotaxis signal transduction protein